MKVKLTVKGDRLTVDFTGTAPQVLGAINSPRPNTLGAVYLGIDALLAPRGPINHGAYKCIDVVLPEDCWINAKWPAATIGCTTHTATKITLPIWQALAKARPEKAVGCTFSECNWFVASVRDSETGIPIVFTELPSGGWGGTPDHDGLDTTMDPLGMCQSMSAEIGEMALPIHWKRFEFRTDSPGPGKNRGGMGMFLQITPLGYTELSQETSRTRIGPPGVNGGGRSLVQYALRKDPDGTVHTLAGYDENGEWHKSIIANAQIPPESSFLFGATGGGGFGDPLERDVEKVLEDVLDEYVSIEGAKRDYGVVIDERSMEIDHQATKKLRQDLSKSEEYRKHLQGTRKDYLPIEWK